MADPSPPLQTEESVVVVDELSLAHAMKAADSIRRHFQESNKENVGSNPGFFSPSVPPGIIQGLAGFLVVGGALLPVRRLVLSHPSVTTHPAFRNFVDLLYSVGHALVATQAALIAGSIYGGKAYLDAFAECSGLRQQSSSAVVDLVCQDLRNNVVGKVRRPTGLESKSYDPRVQTMLSMMRVIEKCQASESQPMILHSTSA